MGSYIWTEPKLSGVWRNEIHLYFGGIDSGLVYNGQTNDIALLMRVIRDRSLSPLVLSPDVLVPVERTWSIDKEVLPAL